MDYCDLSMCCGSYKDDDWNCKECWENEEALYLIQITK